MKMLFVIFMVFGKTFYIFLKVFDLLFQFG